MSSVQSVTFSRDAWTPVSALRWLAKHGYEPTKMVHTTANYYRYRIREPREFRSFRVLKLPGGIDLVLGFS